MYYSTMNVKFFQRKILWDSRRNLNSGLACLWWTNVHNCQMRSRSIVCTFFHQTSQGYNNVTRQPPCKIMDTKTQWLRHKTENSVFSRWKGDIFFRLRKETSVLVTDDDAKIWWLWCDFVVTFFTISWYFDTVSSEKLRRRVCSSTSKTKNIFG